MRHHCILIRFYNHNKMGIDIHICNLPRSSATITTIFFGFLAIPLIDALSQKFVFANAWPSLWYTNIAMTTNIISIVLKCIVLLYRVFK